MNLVFGKIHIVNFMSFEDEWFDWSGNNGVNIIKGVNHDVVGSKNGSGKSTLINALVFAIFGKTIHNIKNKRIPNRFISADIDTEVTLNFTADNIPYQIVTGLKKKSCTAYCKLYKLDEADDEQDITKYSIKLTRQFIEDEIIKCRFDIFLRTNVLTSDQAYNFFKLDKKDKRDFIEQVFDLGVFGVMYSMVHRDLLDMNSEFGKIEREYSVIENTLNVTIRNHEGYMDKKRDELSCELTKLKILKGKYQELKATIPDEFEDFDNRKAELMEKKSMITDKLSGVNSKRSAVQNIISTERDEIRIEDDKINGVVSSNVAFNNKINSFKTSIKTFETDIKRKRDHIAKYEDLYDNLCSDCKPLFDGKFSISEARESIKHITEVDIVAQNESIKIYDDHIKTNKLVVDTHKTVIASINTRIDEHHKRIEKIDGSIGKINDVMVKIKKAEQRFRELELDRKNVEADQIRLSTMKTKLMNGKDLIQERKDEISSGVTPFQEMVDNQTEAFNVIKQKMSDMKGELNYLKMIESVVSEDNLRKIVVKDLVHLLNGQITTYLNRVGVKFNCMFDENLFYEFHTEAGETDYENFSSGEKMRLSIAVSFAFRDFMSSRSGINSNVLILDEYMDSNLDAMAIKELITILTEFNVKCNQDIFIVSHRPELTEDMFNRIITVEKTDGISKIKIETVEV